MSIGDFHTHSTCSDGRLTPTQLVDLAAGRGVTAMALTDHDTLDGYAEAREAAARHPGFRLVPGVELSCDVPGTEVHMLGLGINPLHQPLLDDLQRMQRGRVERAQRMVETLARLGAPISWERVQEIAGEASIGRPHVAQALLEAGHISTFNEAFDRFLGRNAPAYSERDKLSPMEAVAMIHSAGGVAVFAHPSFTTDYVRVAEGLRDAGLFGIEVYYKAYPPALIAVLRALADRLGLFALGGSDFHGIDRPDEREPGDIPLPNEQAEAFLAALAAHGCTLPAPTALSSPTPMADGRSAG